MNQLVRLRLSIMMFLEFFIWGAWLPLIFGYLAKDGLNFTPTQQSWILNAFAMASLAAMFFATQFADRNFAAEKFLAFSHLVGGVAIIGLAFVTDFWTFFALMLIHSFFYVPTISITNSIAFANLTDPKREFGPVRLWGTIGWIAASWPFVFLLVDWAKVNAMPPSDFITWMGAVLGNSKTGAAFKEAIPMTFLVAGGASILLAGFSLFLPHTPPKAAPTSGSSLAWLESLKLLKYPFIFVLFVVTFIDAAVHQCYFIWTDTFLRSLGIPGNWVMPIMSLGQIAEIGTMAILGAVLARLGWKTTMILGVLGHALRFGVFAFVPEPYLAIAVNLVHGVCYAFFFATVYIFVDEFFPKDARSSAQGLFNFLILGAGPFIANFVWPYVGAMVRPVDVTYQVENVSKPYFDVSMAGMLQNPGSGGKTLEVRAYRYTSDDKSELADTIVGKIDDKGQVSGQFKGLAFGKYWFDFDTIRKQQILGDKKAKVATGDLEVLAPAESGKKEPSVSATQEDFEKLFLFPTLTAVAAALLLLLFFHPPARKEEPTPA